MEMHLKNKKERKKKICRLGTFFLETGVFNTTAYFKANLFPLVEICGSNEQ